MLFSHTRLSVLNNDERSTNTTTIRRQVDGSLMVVDEDGDELRHPASTTHATEIVHELLRSTSDTKDTTVQIHNKNIGLVQFGTSQHIDI